MRSIYHEFALNIDDVVPGRQFVRIDLATGKREPGVFISQPQRIATGGKMAEAVICGRTTTLRLEDMGVTPNGYSFAIWSKRYVTVAPEHAHIPAIAPETEAE